MEDKTFLDEKGLAELGRVVKDNFLGIEKLKELNELKAFVDSWHNIEAKYVTLKELEDFKTQHPHGDYLASIDDPITLLISEANEKEKNKGCVLAHGTMYSASLRICWVGELIG